MALFEWSKIFFVDCMALEDEGSTSLRNIGNQAQSHIPEDLNFVQHRCEHLKPRCATC